MVKTMKLVMQLAELTFGNSEEWHHSQIYNPANYHNAYGQYQRSY